MLHALNLGMEALALFATWRAGLRELRVYLGFLLIYDAGLYFAPALIYREAYWICRSADFALLFRVCWASGSVHRNHNNRVPETHGRVVTASEVTAAGDTQVVRLKEREHPHSHRSIIDTLDIWGILCAITYFILLITVWTGTRTDSKLHDLTLASIVLNGSTLVIAACTVKVKWRVWMGCVAWTIAQSLTLAWYPLLSLLPLAIWTICLFGKRDGAEHRLYGEGMGATNDATSQRGKGKAVAGSLADGIEVLPRTV